jgi:hypothetical protein
MRASIRHISPGAPIARENARFFLMNSLLYSRMESGFPSNADAFDEDVNVYLAGLLASVIDANVAPARRPDIALDDLSLAETADASASPREKFELYRESADRLLVGLGIFKNARGRRPDSVEHLRPTGDAYIGRGKVYYALAQSYAVQTFRRSTAVSDCLGKLSHNFERYLAVLSTMRGEYLNLCETLSEGALYHLERSAAITERCGDLSDRYDRFLDAYSSYMRDRSPETRALLEAACEELRSLDPSFTFSIEERERVTSP